MEGSLRHGSRHAVLALSRSRCAPRQRGPETARPSLQGAGIAAADQLPAALEQAFDYRGDVTLTLHNGESIEGYIFDRDPAASTVRILSKPAGARIAVKYAEVAALSFTGRDMADGRSWEAWVKKYAERKAAGEKNVELVPETIE